MMLGPQKNRVQAIKSKFENLTQDTESLVIRKKESHLYKQNEITNENIRNKENESTNSITTVIYSDIKKDEPKPNSSYLYDKSDAKANLNEIKKSLTRQCSDPGKKLHRSHAFRCDRTQKIVSPKRHDSCKGRSETGDFTLRKSNQREEITDSSINEKDTDMDSEDPGPYCSIPDENVPQHILDQYAKVLKPKKNSTEQMTDSGVSSETENQEDERLKAKISEIEPNLHLMEDELCASSETMRLERKNPHVILTDTLKKALKQPLPAGPPPKKPPRVFDSQDKKKDAKKMLEKLEKVLQQREAKKTDKNIYDIAETDLSESQEITIEKPKEIHYLCTEILDITHRTLLPNQIQTDSSDVLKNCFNSLNCVTVTNKSTMSLPYSRLSQSLSNNNLNKCCSCSTENIDVDRPRLSTFFKENPCQKCKSNEGRIDRFKCHLNCNCKEHNSEFFIDKRENIYDVPFGGKKDNMAEKNVFRKSDSYGVVRSDLNRMQSKSLEDVKFSAEEEKIYDIPCDISRPATPDIIQSTSKIDFEKLRSNFENHKQNPETTERKMADKPPTKQKPPFLKSNSDTKMADDFKMARTAVERKFATEKRYKKNERKDVGSATMKRDRKEQLDLDKENLNLLMSEIYETVSAACRMEELKPSRFPTDAGSSTSEDSVKLTRSLTEKRKNYVRRVSSRAAYVDARAKNRYRHQTSVCSYKSDVVDTNYSTFRSWKSFKNSQGNLNKDTSMASKINLTDSTGNILSMRDDFDGSIDNLSIDEKTGCVDLELSMEDRLFDVCLLVGLNYMNGKAYVKSVFPSEVKVPPHIENLVFPETISLEQNQKLDYDLNAEKTQNYSLVLTDERGERRYGYCRRVLPEGAGVCLPLCYCIIGRYRAPGFYYKVLKEIESHHGSSEVEISTILQQLLESKFPNPGEEIALKYEISIHQELISNKYRKSCNFGDIMKSKTLPARRSDVNCTQNDKSPNKTSCSFNVDKCTLKEDECTQNQDKCTSNGDSCTLNKNKCTVKENQCTLKEDKQINKHTDAIPDFYDIENNNRPKTIVFIENEKTKIIKRPLEPRVDESCLSVLLDTFGASLCIKVFGSLLLERKVVIVSDSLSLLSSCMEGLQAILYPFVWQQPLISTIPSELRREILEAPLPILAGLLKRTDELIDEGLMFEEGMLIDVTSAPKVLYFHGDESTILPTVGYKTLKTTLQMESNKNQNRSPDDKTRNVLIAEAFLGFFVETLGAVGGCIGGGQGPATAPLFDKEKFIKSAPSKQHQYFFEWFAESAMFNHFIQNAIVRCTETETEQPDQGIVDAPLPNFYQLFEERLSRSKNTEKISENTKVNYKTAMNRKVKLLKSKLRDLVT